MDLKKGHKRDLWVVFDKEGEQIESIRQFKQVLSEEGIKYSEEKLDHESQIHFYIVNGAQKKDELAELLSRYEFNLEERKLQNATLLHLNLFLVDVERFKSFESLTQLSEFVSTSKKDGAKNLILFENVQEWLSAQVDERVVRQDEFRKWLLRLQIESGVDFIQSCSSGESVETLMKCGEQTIRVKYKKEVVLFREGRRVNADKAMLKGIKNKYQLMWCEMLMSFQGISEDKAIQVALEYPSLRKLLKDFKEPQMLSRIVGQNVSEKLFQFWNQR